MTRGKPFEPGNKFGRGRPPGSRNKTTLGAQKLLESYAEPLTRKLLTMALQGDPKAMHLCIDRVLPARRDTPIKLGNLPTGTATELADASEKLLGKVAAGKLTPFQGQAVAELLERRRRVIETHSLDERLRKLEVQP